MPETKANWVPLAVTDSPLMYSPKKLMSVENETLMRVKQIEANVEKLMEILPNKSSIRIYTAEDMP